MIRIHDLDGDTVELSDATAEVGRPAVSLVARNLPANGSGTPDEGEVWLTTDRARDLAHALRSYADLVDVQDSYRHMTPLPFD